MRRTTTTFLGLCLCLLTSAPSLVALDGDKIQTHVFKNGMKVVLWPDHSIPNLAMYTFFRVGSRNERPGITGLSHFFEHMMFLGSRNYAPGEFDRTMEAAGGANNAFTGQDITVYQDWFPKSAINKILELEADRIGFLAIDSVQVESERGVVASERRRSVDDSNIRSLDEEAWASAFKAHPYQWPVIGWMVDIENWKSKDLSDYFKTYYAPNNATVCIVGDFNPVKILETCKRYLEALPRGPEPARVTTAEPQQKGERRVELVRQAQVPAVIASWHIPATSHEDYYVFRVLETLLLQGQSSRLHLRLVERDQLVINIWGGMDYAMDPTIFQIFMQAKQNIDTRDCEHALYAELDRLKENKVGKRELLKAKNQLAADFYRNLESISGKAMTLGFSDVYFGDPKSFLNVVERFEQVSSEDIQRIVSQYFNKQNRTVSTLIPESKTDDPQSGLTPQPTDTGAGL